MLFSGDEWGELSAVKTVREAVALYETVGMPSRNLSARTRVEYSRDLADLAGFLESHGARLLASVSIVHLQGYQAWMDRSGLVTATRRRKTLTVKGCFRFLHGHGLIASPVAATLIPPRVPKREPRFLSESEYRALLDASSANPRDTALLQLFLQTGLCLSEVARLTIDDIELPDRITPNVEDAGWVHVRRNGGGQDRVPLNYRACHALEVMLQARPASLGHRALFVSRLGGPLSKRRIQAAVAEHLLTAGIRDASVHTLRHTMATHHIARGTTLETVQETLGHADVATTALYYVPLAKRAQRQALQEHAL
ncbi:MAG: tyrosine-type recombinase/integrase [Ardenticatenia bacterium]|nr:tyrosine-type recombinase/integrase [Ardenticatenia bacterium]